MPAYFHGIQIRKLGVSVQAYILTNVQVYTLTYVQCRLTGNKELLHHVTWQTRVKALPSWNDVRFEVTYLQAQADSCPESFSN